MKLSKFSLFLRRLQILFNFDVLISLVSMTTNQGSGRAQLIVLFWGGITINKKSTLNIIDLFTVYLKINNICGVDVCYYPSWQDVLLMMTHFSTTIFRFSTIIQKILVSFQVCVQKTTIVLTFLKTLPNIPSKKSKERGQDYSPWNAPQSI